MPRKKFELDELNKRIKPRQDVEAERQKKLALLCEELGFDPSILNDCHHPLFVFCMELAKRFVPGFQVNRSGNKKRNNFLSDLELALKLNPLPPDDYQFSDENWKKAWKAQLRQNKGSQEKRAKLVAEENHCTLHKVLKANERYNERVNQAKNQGFAALFTLYMADDGTGTSAKATEDRHTKNRKNPFLK